MDMLARGGEGGSSTVLSPGCGAPIEQVRGKPKRVARTRRILDEGSRQPLARDRAIPMAVELRQAREARSAHAADRWRRGRGAGGRLGGVAAHLSPQSHRGAGREPVRRVAQDRHGRACLGRDPAMRGRAGRLHRHAADHRRRARRGLEDGGGRAGAAQPALCQSAGRRGIVRARPGRAAGAIAPVARGARRADAHRRSTSIRSFEDELRHAGATARVLLCKAAARRWGTDWQAAAPPAAGDPRQSKLGFGALAAEAADESVPGDVPLRTGDDQPALRPAAAPARCAGQGRRQRQLCRGRAAAQHGLCLDPEGPIGETVLVKLDRAAANKVPGMLAVVTTDDWVAAVANNGGRRIARSTRCARASRRPRTWSTAIRSRRR
jgi:hypothetical protein